MYQIGTISKQRAAHFAALVDSMKGKRGIIQLREKLDRLSSFASSLTRKNTYRIHHHSTTANHRDFLYLQNMADHALLRRGNYGELVQYPLSQCVTHQEESLIYISIPKNHKVAFGQSFQTLQAAQKAGLILEEYSDYDAKGRGDGVAISIYGIYNQGKVILVQVRESSRQYKKWFLNLKKSYFLTDGLTCQEVSAKQVHAALKYSSDPASPIFYLSFKNPEIAEKFGIEENTTRSKYFSTLFSEKKSRTEEPVMVGWKAVYQAKGECFFRSIYDPSFCWPVGSWVRQKISWNKEESHPSSGLYFYSSEEAAKKYASSFDGDIVIVRVQAKKFRPVSGAKFVASHLRIVPDGE